MGMGSMIALANAVPTLREGKFPIRRRRNGGLGGLDAGSGFGVILTIEGIN